MNCIHHVKCVNYHHLIFFYSFDIEDKEAEDSEVEDDEINGNDSGKVVLIQCFIWIQTSQF